MLLSPNMLHVEDPLHLGKPRLDSGLALSKSTPDLNSVLLTQAEINAKRSKAEREAAKEKAIQLRKKREDLKSKLDEKLLELRSICLQEANITGKVPAEFPEIPGLPAPTISKRISTEFTLSSKFLEKDMITTNDAIEKLELEIEIQQQKANAVRKLSEDKSLSKSARRSHHLDYLSQNEKLKQLRETLKIYMEERGQGKVSFSKTTDDVDYKLVPKGNNPDQMGYRTLPNRHKRHQLSPQQQRDSADTTQSPYKISSDSAADSISMSSNSSSVVSSGQDRQMAYHPDSSSISSHDYTQPFDGWHGGVSHRFPSGSQPRRKDPSMSPSSDRASSGSGSLSSLHLNPGISQDGGTYGVHQGASSSSRLDSEGDYSSYLRNTQKTYFRPGGKYACGSLDRRKLVKKHGLDLASPNAALQVVELTPSKYGSKRDSAADSRDSQYSFQDADSVDKPFGARDMGYESQNFGRFGGPSHAVSLGQLKASSGESGVYLSAAEERKTDARFRQDFEEKRLPNYASGNGSFGQDSGSFGNENFRNHGASSATTLQTPDGREYGESLRRVPQERYESQGSRATPWPSSDVWLGPAVQAKRAPDFAGADANGNAVDALFKHNSQLTQLKSVEYFRRNSSDVPIDSQPQQHRLLSDYNRVNSSSASSLSSHPSMTPAPQPLRFVKVVPNDQTLGGAPGFNENSSYPQTPRPFKVNGCSTLV